MRAIGAALGFGLLSSLTWSAGAIASDYYHECGMPGGAYRMHDETLYTGTGDDEKEVRYTPISKVVISETDGFCVGKTGTKYGFSSRRYLQRVEIRSGGERIKLDFYCELASDGTPAGDECTRQVKTRVKRLIPVYDTTVTKIPGAPGQD